MSTALHRFTYYRSFTYKYWTILHFLVTFFIRFEEKQIKKADEANKSTILSFSILARTLNFNSTIMKFLFNTTIMK